MRLETAKIIARDIVRKLEPFCTRIHIAGSVRREKEEVKDIEVICTPLKVQKGGKTLFDDDPVEYEVSKQFINAVNNLGQKLKGSPEGRYCQMFVAHSYGKINCDIFIPQEHDYYRQLCIRTGSRDFVHHTIAVAWREKNWVGTEDGLRRIEECENINEDKFDKDGIRMKPKYICIASKPMLPPFWKSEEHFEWIGLDYITPKDRI
jgi:DNA polymerase/3'-5' exonuclease PolX